MQKTRGDLQNEVYADQNTTLTALANTERLTPRLGTQGYDAK
jgi:hypothetical protein